MSETVAETTVAEAAVAEAAVAETAEPAEMATVAKAKMSAVDRRSNAMAYNRGWRDNTVVVKAETVAAVEAVAEAAVETTVAEQRCVSTQPVAEAEHASLLVLLLLCAVDGRYEQEYAELEQKSVVVKLEC